MLSLLLSAAVASQVAAAPTPPPVAAEPVADTDIVVEGRRDDPHDAANRSRKIIVGSRIPQPSFQNNPGIASATSLGGLTPSSGLDAFKNDTSLVWRSCQVGGYSVSQQTGCALRNASKAIAAENWLSARAILAAARSAPDVSLDGHYLIHRMAYQVATELGDQDGRRRALAGMVGTGLMSVMDESSALRTLATMAKRAGDRDDAIASYRAAIEIDADDFQSRINLGSLLQESGDEAGARLQFAAAIAAMERQGTSVPDNLRLAAK